VSDATLSRGNWLGRSVASVGLRNANTNLRLGAAIVALWVLIALFAPWIAPYDPIAQDMSARLHAPNLAHLFGTDNFGRDILSRVIYGTRVDLKMGVLGVLFPFLIGTTLGSIAGYAGRWADAALMRLVDVVIAFPFLVLLMAIITILEPGLTSFYVALAMVGWVSYARLVRAQVLVLKTSDFVVAARSLGFGTFRILFRHIVPNCIAGSIVFSMSDVVLTILAGSAISYLGLGVQPPTAEWGVMIKEGQNFIATAWWITTFPGVAIVLMTFGFSLLADGLAERFGLRQS
jgi:peptide/nickel transport system permease protein